MINESQQNSNNGVSSLETLAAQTVGENTDKIGMNTVQGLPTSLQTAVAWFLPASALLQLNEVLTERGVNLDPMWTEHVNKIWPREMTVWGRKADPIRKFFKEESPKELYCRLFFDNLLGHQDQQEDITHKWSGPHLDVFFTPLHQIQRDSVYQESHPRALSQQKQTILVPLSRNLHQLTLGNRVLCKLMKDYRKVWETLLSNVNSFRVFSISRTKGVHALQFLLQAMAERSLKAFGLDFIQENDAVLMLLLLVCSGILQQGPRAMEVINSCLSEFSADQIGEAKPLLELIHDFLFPPLTVEPLSDVSDASDDDSGYDPSCPIDLYNEALQPLKTQNRELSFETNQGKAKRNQSEASLQDTAYEISTGTSLGSNHCVCTQWLGGNYTHVPREGGFPPTGLECFVLNRASERTPKCLELSLPHWTSLRKLVLGSIAINCQDLRAVLPLVERGQLTHLLLDNVEACYSLFARVVKALATAQGCREQDVPVLQHLTMKFGSTTVCGRECEDFIQEVTLTPMHGVEELVLFMDVPDDAVEDLLCAYLQADLSISNLTLSPYHRSCFGGRVPYRILDFFAGKASLTNVELNSWKLDNVAVQGLIVKLFSECKNLQGLAFLACFATKDSLFSGGFTEMLSREILTHPSLKTLTLDFICCAESILSVLEAVLTEDCVLKKLVVKNLASQDIYNVIAGIEGEQKCRRQTKLKCLELEQTTWTGLDWSALGKALEPFVERFQYTGAYDYSCSLQDFEAMM